MIRSLYKSGGSLLRGSNGLVKVGGSKNGLVNRYLMNNTSVSGHSRFFHNQLPLIEECPEPTYDTGCTYCMPDMNQFPNQNKPLPPSPIHAKQLVICSGTSNWPSKIDGEADSLAGIIGSQKRSLIDPQYPVMITNCDLPSTSTKPNSTSAFLFPDNLYFDNIPLNRVSEFFEFYVRPSSFDSVKTSLIPEPTSASPLILICGHGQRDLRCGLVAPLLEAEFKKVLQEKGLLYDAETNPSGTRVAISSHVGGHAFAGNVIFHPGNSSILGTASIWYGKVFPFHVQGIVEQTIINGRVIQSLLRGYGPQKW